MGTDGCVCWDYETPDAECHCEASQPAKRRTVADQRRQWSRKMQDFGRECDSHALDIPSFTPFGSYTLIYVDSDGEEYCGKCAANVELELTLQDYGTYDEGPDMECAGCGDTIESSYGDPDESEVTP